MDVKADKQRTRFGNAARFFIFSKRNKSVYNTKLWQILKVDQSSSGNFIKFSIKLFQEEICRLLKSRKSRRIAKSRPMCVWAFKSKMFVACELSCAQTSNFPWQISLTSLFPRVHVRWISFFDRFFLRKFYEHLNNFMIIFVNDN